MAFIRMTPRQNLLALAREAMEGAREAADAVTGSPEFINARAKYQNATNRLHLNLQHTPPEVLFAILMGE